MKVIILSLLVCNFAFSQNLKCSDYKNYNIEEKLKLNSTCEFDYNLKLKNYNSIFKLVHSNKIKHDFPNLDDTSLNKITNIILENSNKKKEGKENISDIMEDIRKYTNIYNSNGMLVYLNRLYGLPSNFSYTIKSINANNINVIYTYSVYKEDDIEKNIPLN